MRPRAWAKRISLCACCLLAVAARLPATTIELKSGNGAVGTIDPLNDISTNWGATFQDAIIVAGDPAYDIIPGTQWISISSTGYGGPEFSSNVLFRATFQLPDGFSSPTFSIQVHADNSATVFLNGFKLGEHPFDEMGINESFQDPAEVFATSDPGLFSAGENVLEIRVYNASDPLGVDYIATVSFIPEPAPTMLAGIGAMVVVAFWPVARMHRATARRGK